MIMFLSRVMFKCALAMTGVIHHIFSNYSCNKTPANPLKAPSPAIMPDVTRLASMKPAFPSGTASPGFVPSTARSIFTDTTLPPLEDVNMQGQGIFIFSMFFATCLLLLLVFFYIFWLKITITKNMRMAHMWEMEREDATYRRSSSETQSVGNMV